MNSLKVTTIVLALGFAAGIGCGSDSGKSPDAPVIGPGTGGAVGTGGTVGMDAGMGGVAGTTGAGGAGGVIGMDGGGGSPDVPMATGGAGGSLDGGGAGGTTTHDASIIDAPMHDVGPAVDSSVGETGPTATNICTGLTVDQCNLAIINGPVAATVVAQAPPVTNPPDYATCSQ